MQQGATLFWKSRDEHLSERRELEANAEMALQSLKKEAEERLRERELQLQQWAQQLTAQHAADLLAEKQSAQEAADREVQQRRSLQDQADRDTQHRLAQEAMVAAAAGEMEAIRLKDLEVKRRERLKKDEQRQRQERELQKKVYDLEKGQKDRDEQVRLDCQFQLNEQRRFFMGEKAQREQEFMEKARQFEEQVRSGGATSSGPPLFKMTPTATEAGQLSPPTTPPLRRSVERLELCPQRTSGHRVRRPKFPSNSGNDSH